jgi:hypothetical protein
MKMNKEQIEDRLNGLIEEIIDAERQVQATEGMYRTSARQDYQETRKRVMDTLIEIYVG